MKPSPRKEGYILILRWLINCANLRGKDPIHDIRGTEQSNFEATAIEWLKFIKGLEEKLLLMTFIL